MKKWLITLLIPALLSCSNTDKKDGFYDISQNDRGEIDSFNLPKHAVNDLVKGLAYQMLSSSTSINENTPIAVASFVNLNDLETTNWLGNQVAESFMHELQRHGLVVVDFKTTGHIRVTEQGDYIFTRNWKELSGRQIIDYVVAGTMVEQEDGIMINARMIDVESHIVVATSQSFMPDWMLRKEKNYSDHVKMKEGMIIRKNNKLIEEQRAVQLKNN